MTASIHNIHGQTFQVIAKSDRLIISRVIQYPPADNSNPKTHFCSRCDEYKLKSEFSPASRSRGICNACMGSNAKRAQQMAHRAMQSIKARNQANQ